MHKIFDDFILFMRSFFAIQKLFSTSGSNLKMKTHWCIIHLQNRTDRHLIFNRSWYDSGEIYMNQWKSVSPQTSEVFVNCQTLASMAGCSGFAIFEHEKQGKIAIAFSNPNNPATNKLGVDFNKEGEQVWDKMQKHQTPVTVQGRNLKATFKNTSGEMNKCEVIIEQRN